MAAVMIGVDPHKASHTAVAIGAAEEPLGELRVRASAAQAGRLVEWAAPWPERTWAAGGAGGLGYLLARQLAAAGELVLDVQPKLGARVRLLATGASNKNDPNDARSVAIAALRPAAPRKVAAENHAAVLKLWSKRHRDLGRTRNQVACRLHAVLCELVPGGISKEITAGKAAHMLESTEPSGAVALARCELAAAFPGDLRRIDAQMPGTKKKLAVTVRAPGTTLTGIFGVGPVIAATMIGYAADVSRFPSRDNFAAYNGTAPIEVSSGNRKTCRLSRRGNRRLNHADPHGRGHPDPLPPQRRPGLLRPQARRGQDPQRGPPLPQTAGQRRHLRPPAGRRPPGRRSSQDKGPGRATGERLCRQRGRLTPRKPALRPSHSRARHHPTTPGPARTHPSSTSSKEKPERLLTQRGFVMVGELCMTVPVVTRADQSDRRLRPARSCRDEASDPGAAFWRQRIRDSSLVGCRG
jgi:transposase